MGYYSRTVCARTLATQSSERKYKRSQVNFFQGTASSLRVEAVDNHDCEQIEHGVDVERVGPKGTEHVGRSERDGPTPNRPSDNTKGVALGSNRQGKDLRRLGTSSASQHLAGCRRTYVNPWDGQPGRREDDIVDEDK